MIISGIAHWAKVVGAPGWGYKNQYKEWSMDVAIDESTEAKLLEAGMDKSYIKNKGDDRGNFITFKRRELKRDGSPGKPIAIVDARGSDWDGKTLIGNGSKVDCKIILNDVEGQKGTKPGLLKVRVAELVAFEGREDDEDFTYDTSAAEEWS